MNEIENDPEFKKWVEDVERGLIPKMQDSEVILQLVPKGPTDVKFALELGLSIMMNKPIIALVHTGTDVPEKLLKIADKVIFYTDLSEIQEDLADAIRVVAQ